MKKWIIREQDDNKTLAQTAHVKARFDLEEILTSMDANLLLIKTPPYDEKTKNRVLKKIFHHKALGQYWKMFFDKIPDGDIVFLQYPIINHTLYFEKALRSLRKRNVKTIAYVHDLEYIRYAQKTEDFFRTFRIKKEETSALKEFSKIIVHNEAMFKFMRDKLNVPKEKMLILQIFDYLTEAELPRLEIKREKNTCNIAGNLNPLKSEYVYYLPDKFKFELYGPNYQGEKNSELVTYHGAFEAEELPVKLKGAFGLIWDGNSTETCSGIMGEYLKFNNPHKTSLYLASGIPVIVWEEAAIAPFILSKGVGITIKSLTDLPTAVANISDLEYLKMQKAAFEISKELRSGFYTKQAADEAIKSFE